MKVPIHCRQQILLARGIFSRDSPSFPSAMESSWLRGLLSDSSLGSVGRNSKTGTTTHHKGGHSEGPGPSGTFSVSAAHTAAPVQPPKEGATCQGAGSTCRALGPLTLRGSQDHTSFKAAPTPFLTVSQVCDGAFKLSCLCHGGEHARHRVALTLQQPFQWGSSLSFSNESTEDP